MRPITRFRQLVWALAIALVTTVTPWGSAGDEAIPPEVFQRVADVLAGRRLAKKEDWVSGTRTRAPSSLRRLFRQTVRAVPFVVSPDGTGSAVVVAVNYQESSAWVITNHHVVERPFYTDDGLPYAMLLFYEPQLAAEPFEVQRFAQCSNARSLEAWCITLLRSLRRGVVVGTDPDRDLTLLLVPNVPREIQPITEAIIDTVEPGDDVAVISHPQGLLWTLTAGIVSGVRLRYPMGRARGTIIQTQTPVSEGSSGSPLLTPQARLIGVIAWVVKDAEGLNAAIAINEVQAFVFEQVKRFRSR